MAGPGPLEFAPTEPVGQDRPHAFGDGPLDLKQELVVRVVADRAVDDGDGAPGLPELLQQDGLVDVPAGQPAGAVHDDGVEPAAGRRVPEAVQPGAVQLADESADVVISNGVLNLCPDKPGVLAEAYRVLRPGGRLQMADLLLEEGVTPEEVARKGSWSD